MNKFSTIAYLTAVWLVALTGAAVAQDADSNQDKSDKSKSEKIAAVSPRFGVEYTTEGAGFESLGSFDAFVPVFQTPGQNLTFVQGRLFLDTDSQMGGHVLLGHRIYDKKNDRLVGTYIGYDARDTGENYFRQLALGVETLGKWDFRANAYIPLDDTRQQVGNALNTGVAFSGNNAFAQQLRFYEVGLHGVDAEIGTKLASLGQGDLRGYAGAYYYSAGDREAFGWKTRLEARPTNFVGINLSLQNDALFDTRAVFSVGVSFPGSSNTKGKKNAENLARMGDFIERRTTIPIIEDSELTTATNPLTNPATGQAWNIIHVAEGGNSNGTFQSPYGFNRISQALTDATTKPGSLIYVRGNGGITLPGFSLPPGVSMASSLGIGSINTRELGMVSLPGEGLGVSPTIAGNVILGSNTSLNGFTVNGSVVGENISNVNITNNTIQNATTNSTLGTLGEGITLRNVTGNVNIVNNTIRNNSGEAIAINNNSGRAEIAIANNQLSGNLGGVLLTGLGNSQLTARITGNTVTNTPLSGIGVELTDTSQSNISIANNTVNTIRLDELSDGIFVEMSDRATTSGISISGNTINNTQGRGISVASTSNATGSNVAIANNRVDTTDAQGIAVVGINGTTTISNNTVNNAFSEGIYLENTNGRADIFGNTVTNTRNPAEDTDLESGIFIWNYRGNGVFNIVNNTVGTNPGFSATDYRVDGIEFNLCRDVDPIYTTAPCTAPATATVNITNNTIIHNGNITGGADGIDLNLGEFATATFNISGNRVERIPDEGVSINAVAASRATFNINNNTIRNVGDSGIEVDLFLPDLAISDAVHLYNRSVTEFNISGNTISNPGNDGIDFDIQDQAQTRVNITNNNISNIGDGESGDRAIQLETSNSSRMCTTINQNTISNAPNGSRLRTNGTNSTLQVVDTATLSTRNGGATITTNGTTNVSACP